LSNTVATRTVPTLAVYVVQAPYLLFYTDLDGDGVPEQNEADDERILEGEQGRALHVVQAWFANR
jgi:hypothetical protein